MPSSSLIFVLIVGLWAVFLLQHWIRRREALATARSVDRFSEGMRVLKRRDAGHASTGEAGSTTSAARPSLRAGQTVIGDDMDTDSTVSARSSRRAQVRRRMTGGARGTGSHAVEPTPRRTTSGVSHQRIGAGALLLALTFLVVAVLGAPFGLLPWWSPVAALVLTGGVVAWLRHTAVQARSARAASRPAAPRPVAARSAPDRPQAKTRPASAPTPRPVAPVSTASSRPTPKPVPVAPAPERDSFFDAVAVEASLAKSRPAAPVEGGWDPVAVPRPTYAMKAKADRAPVEPAPATEGAAVRVEDLPFDGLALDEDLEELPAVYRVG